jgi:hypothetical protein
LNVDSTVGEELTQLTRQTGVFEEETIHLSQSIASASSITTIAKRAEESGFTANQSFVSLSAPLPLAYIRQSP